MSPWALGNFLYFIDKTNDWENGRLIDNENVICSPKLNMMSSINIGFIAGLLCLYLVNILVKTDTLVDKTVSLQSPAVVELSVIAHGVAQLWCFCRCLGYKSRFGLYKSNSVCGGRSCWYDWWDCFVDCCLRGQERCFTQLTLVFLGKSEQIVMSSCWIMRVCVMVICHKVICVLLWFRGCFLSAKKWDFQAFQDDSLILAGTLNIMASDSVYPLGPKKKKKTTKSLIAASVFGRVPQAFFGQSCQN